MISQLLKTGLRNIRQNKVYAFIHLTSLSLGLCSAFCVFLYLSDELSYDRFHEQGENIYRVSETTRFNGTENRYPTTPAILADFIRLHVPEVQITARIFQREGALQINATSPAGITINKFREAHVLFADPDIFSILSFRFLKGDVATVLQNPNEVVISRRIAEKYFGSADRAVGQEILFEGTLPLVVSAVIENYPDQSHLIPEVILHFEHYYATESDGVRQFLRNDWVYNPLYTYVLLKPETARTTANKSINQLQTKYGDERAATGVKFDLQPLKDIHLYSDFTFSEQPNAIRYVCILAAIGLLILIIACVNFINLSTVHALKRAKEIGVRKVLGAGKTNLAAQFMSETTVTTCVAFVISLVMLYLALPGLNILSGKHFTASDLLQGQVLAGMLGILTITLLLAGTYPSVFITRFNPLAVLKGFSAHRGRQGYQLRRVLVVVQFSMAIMMVVLAFVFHQQMDFIYHKPLGYQKDHILTIPIFSEDPNSFLGGGVDIALRGRMNTLEDEILRQDGAEAITVSSALPGQGAVTALVQTDTIQEQDNVFVAATSVDYDFLDTYKIALAAGRNFSKASGTDHLEAFILNQSAARQLGWRQPHKAIGQHLQLLGKQGYVVGVVEDFHFQSLQQPLRPLILEVAAGKFTTFSLRLPRNRPVKKSIAIIQQAWNNVFPEKVFDHQFLDEQLQEAYGHEQRLSQLMQCFSFLTILISALGLFGLAAYVNHRRAKEVSIRKMLGASPAQVFALLVGEFIKFVLLALVIGCPLSYWAGTVWLDSFAYKITVHITPFIVGAVVAILSVLIAVSYETIRSARINPADQLRKE